MNRVAVIDYGLCNIDSVRRAVQEVGGEAYVAATGIDLGEPDRIVLPGVGAYPDAMVNLNDRDLVTAVEAQVLGVGVPLLGICLGMQLLATGGSEGAVGGTPTPGLGWVPGTVERLQPTTPEERVPHVGWNEVDAVAGARLFGGVPPGSDFYFVHSYHLIPDSIDDIAATTPHCGGFVSAVERGVVFGTQFHPEKSQRAGLAVLRSFLAV